LRARNSNKNATILIAKDYPLPGMKQFLPIIVLVCCAVAQAPEQGQGAPAPAAGTSPASNAQSSNPADENSRKAKELIEQAIAALGGETYLNIRDREQQGRGYGFHHGRAEGGGNVFWDFIEFPDKERVEITKERDIAQLYVGNKGWEITFKGPHPLDPKDLDQYLRRRHFSLDSVLRTWVNAPGVILLYEGNSIAAQHPAQRVTLINAQNESITLYFDEDTHLPVKKSFEWRDPVDRQKNLEEEIYENYRSVSGIMAPFNVTRYFNGDMASQRFFNSVAINQGLDAAMFDPNSGYNPNKPGKAKK
jgi:hypothetical protein